MPLFSAASLPYVLLILYAAASAFGFHNLHPTATKISHCTPIFPHNAEFGELSIPEAPRLSTAWIQAAEERLPWELVGKDNHEITDDAEGTAWQSGERWCTTRQSLVNMWVLPRDMTNGAWENYAMAANRGEEKILSKVPQLLRLESMAVVDSAKMVLQTLKLPPALLRQEPILLAMEAERLLGGFKRLYKEFNLEEALVRESCKNEPGLLVEASINWTNPKLSP